MLGSLYSWISPHIETKNSYTQTWFKEEPEQIKFLDENQVSAIRSKEARPSLRCCGVGCGACLATGFGAARDVSLGAAFALQLALTGVGTALVLAAAALRAAGTGLFSLVFEEFL